MFEFYSPYYLLLLLLVPVLIWYYERRRKNIEPRMIFPSGEILKQTRWTLRTIYARYNYVTRILIFILIVFALARPRAGTKKQIIHTEGIDIVLAIDISTSMQAMDFTPNRLEAAKKIAIDFVRGRISDRIGVISFAGESFTQCPLTIDYNIVIRSLHNLNFATQEWDGTAIGNAIATAVNRLKSSKAKSKVVILLTDGVNNTGEIDPKTAAQLAKTFNIKIYTIGAGTKGTANYPVITPFGKRVVPMKVEIDEELLKEIASITGGKYFRATDNQTLKQIYEKINKLEKSRIEVKEFINYKELFVYFVLGAFLLSLLLFIIENYLLRTIPE